MTPNRLAHTVRRRLYPLAGAVGKARKHKNPCISARLLLKLPAVANV